MLFTPSNELLKSDQRPAFWLRQLPWFILFIGTLFTILYWHHATDIQTSFAQLRFITSVEKNQEVANKRLASHESVPRAIQGLFNTSESVSENQWERFIHALDPDSRFPGILQLAFVRQVSQSDRDRFEQDNGVTIATPEVRDEYFVVTFQNNNKELASPFPLGFDLGTEKKRRLAAQQARDTGHPVLSLSFPWQISDRIARLQLHFWPVYRPGTPLTTVAERRAAFTGLVLAIYEVRPLFQDVLQGVNPEIRVEVFDGPAIQPVARIYDSEMPHQTTQIATDNLTVTARAEVEGGNWSLRYSPTALFLGLHKEQGILIMIPAGGFTLTGALSLAVWILISGRERAINLAIQMSSAYRESEEHLRRTVLHAPIPILIHQSNHNIILVNWYWCELSGQPKESFSTLSEWVKKAVSPNAQLSAMRLLGLPFEENHPFKEGELTLLLPENEERVWFVRSRPLGNQKDGEEIIISMAMDITERKKSEEMLHKAKMEAEA
ncbi:MAG: CHASE domain-containing protein [Magnetococcus sp. DMHC-6]